MGEPRIEYGAGSSTLRQAQESQAQDRLRLLPSRERGTACRRGWVPVCTGTTVGMGESPSPQPSPVEGEGDGVPPGMGSRLRGNDGCVWGVTLTPSRERGTACRRGWVPVCTGTTVGMGGVHPHPALSRRGRGGRRAAGDGFPSARERRVCVGSHPHPSPLPARERGTACRRGWVPVCTGTTVGIPAPYRVRGRLFAGMTGDEGEGAVWYTCGL